MARLNGSLTTSAQITLSASASKTVLQIAAPSTTCVAIKGFGLSFDSDDGALEGVEVRLSIQTTAGTATSRSPQKVNRTVSDALQSGGLENATVEPTTTDILRTYLVNAQTGIAEVFSEDGEIILGFSDRIGLIVITPAGVTPQCTAWMDFEE